MSVNSEMARLSTAKHDILVSLETLGADVQLDDSLDDVCRLLADVARINIDVSALIDRTIGNITLPAGVTSIGESAFMNCTSLVSISLPSSLKSIGFGAFYGCTSLALTSLPAGVTSIGEAAFLNCTSLTDVTFQGTPTSINEYAFYGCTNLTTINVPWASGAVAGAPWGATNATINYNS